MTTQGQTYDTERVAEELGELVRQATVYAENLAKALHAKHYAADVPQWSPLSGDLIGLLTQIDNMTSGLSRALSPAPAVAGWREAWSANPAAAFADMYRSGAQGAEMDADTARDLALAIDALLAASPASPAPAPAADAVVGALRRAREFIDGMSLTYNFGCDTILTEIDAALQPSPSTQEAPDPTRKQLAILIEDARGKAAVFADKNVTFREIEGALREASALLGPKEFINDTVRFLDPASALTRDAMAQEAPGGVLEQANAIASSAFTWLKDAELTEEQTDMVHGAIQVAARAALSDRATPQAGDQSPAPVERYWPCVTEKPVKDGGWVRYSDHVAALAEKEAEKQVAEAREELKRLAFFAGTQNHTRDESVGGYIEKIEAGLGNWVDRASAAEAREADLRRALVSAERHIVQLYDGIAPQAKYTEELTINGHVSGNRHADNDDVVKIIRATLTASKERTDAA